MGIVTMIRRNKRKNLRDVVVERDDGTSEIKRGIQDIRQIIQKGIVLFLTTILNPISFGEGRGISLFLLIVRSGHSNLCNVLLMSSPSDNSSSNPS